MAPQPGSVAQAAAASPLANFLKPLTTEKQKPYDHQKLRENYMRIDAGKKNYQGIH